MNSIDTHEARVGNSTKNAATIKHDQKIKEPSIDFNNYSKLFRICFTRKSRDCHEFKNKIASLSPTTQKQFHEKFDDLIQLLIGNNFTVSEVEREINELGSESNRSIRLELFRDIFREMMSNLPENSIKDLEKRLTIWMNDPLNKRPKSAMKIIKDDKLDNYADLLYSFFRDHFLNSVDVKLEAIPENINEPLPLSLENIFQKHALNEQIDIWNTKFRDFLEPNELFPENLEEHLARMHYGYIVSTGTERSFFNLIYAPENLCEGLICLDLNPRVKAYNDFNVMLIRLCETPEEYSLLSSNIKTESEFAERIYKISALLVNSDIPHQTKKYYHENLKSMGVVFFRQERIWRSSKPNRNFYNFQNIKNYTSWTFDKSNYASNVDHFLKIKKYADQGNIITITRDIFDLSFLELDHIGLVDISNIGDYFIVDFKGLKPNARILYYDFLQNDERKKYQSYLKGDQDITETQRKILKDIISKQRTSDPQKKYPMMGKTMRNLLRTINQQQTGVDSSELKLGFFISKDNYEFFDKIRPKN